MPRALWKGSISFGLVHVPVRLHPASQDKDVRFHEIDERSSSRIRHKTVSEKTGREVPNDRIVKGYEVADGRWVTLTEEELRAAEPARTHTIDVEDFVLLSEIDPLQLSRSYWCAPDGEGARRAYALLRAALEETGKVGIGRFVLRTKEHLVALRPLQGSLVVHTLLFADEVVKASKVEGLPVKVKPDRRELDAAEQLVESLTVPWEPERHRDRHRRRLLDVIERKAAGEEIAVEEAGEPEKVADLMEALEASLAAARKAGGRGRDRSNQKGRRSA